MKVWFLQGEQMTSVSRPGSTADEALRELLRGPTAAERSLGQLGPVNRALASLLSDGSVDGLARQWLTFDPAKARVLG